MIFKNILYKEWRLHRKAFLLVILGATLVSAFLPHRIAAWITFFYILPFYSAGLCAIFAAEAKTIDFLDAKPITRTNLWLAKIIPTFIVWGLAVFIMLICHFVLVKVSDPAFSILSILLNPHFFFILLLSLAIYSLVLFIAACGIFRDKEVAQLEVAQLIIRGAVIAMVIIMWFLGKHLHIKIDIHPLNFRHETLALFISYVATLTVFTVASYLAFVHRETFYTGLLRRKIVYFVLLTLILAIIFSTLTYVISIPVLPENVGFINNIVVSGDGKQIAFSGGSRPGESQTWTTDDKGMNLRRIGDRFTRPISLTKAVYGKHYQLLWMSQGWLYGPENWVQGPYGTIRLSEKDYRHKTYVGTPYLSPDKDRVAYVREVSNWKQGSKKKKYVAIASVDGFEVPYEIGGEEEFDISPVGWTPNGNRFYFHKVSSRGKQKKQDSLRAIDKNAQTMEVVMEDFSKYQMDCRDVAEDGDWVSLVSEEKEGYSLWLMNTETKEKTKVDSSKSNFSVRSWSLDGKRIAYTKLSSRSGDIPARPSTDYGDRDLEQVNPTCYLYVLKATDGQIENVLTKTLPVILELKWSPDGKKLLFRTVADKTGEKLGLVDIDSGRDGGIIRIIVDKLARGFQYEWLESENVVYAKDGKLIAMNISQLTETQLFPPVKKSE